MMMMVRWIVKEVKMDSSKNLFCVHMVQMLHLHAII